MSLSTVLEKVIRMLELVEIERLLPPSHGCVGRPPQDRVAMARAFVAKAVLDLPTTAALIDRLKADRALRRICSCERVKAIPAASRCSRAFDNFSAQYLSARVRDALIRRHLGDQRVCPIARDATEIDTQEKPAPKPKPAASSQTHAQPKQRGRPSRGEVRLLEPTLIARQLGPEPGANPGGAADHRRCGDQEAQPGLPGERDQLPAAHRHGGWGHPDQRDPPLGLGT